VMREAGRIARWTVVLLAVAALFLPEAEAAVNPRAVVILPFDASTLEREYQWIGQGVAEVVRLGLAQHPAFIQVDEPRMRVGRPEAWSEAAVTQAVRMLRADAAVFGQVSRLGTDLVVQPRLMQVKSARVEAVALEPITAIVQWERYIALASQLPSEKDWVDVARQHLRKLKSQIKQ
jgi:TolB-like protein